MTHSPSFLRFVLAPLALAVLPAIAAAQVGVSVDAATVSRSLAVSRCSLQELSLPAQAGASFAVPLALDGAPMQLLLSPHSMRSPHFQLLVQVEGGAIVQQDPAPVATYRGEVEGVPGSVVSASLIDGQLTALIRLAPGLPVFGVQPASSAVPGAPHRLHAVYSGADRLALDAECGTDTSAPWVPQTPIPAGPADVDKVCEIACDADVEYYTKNQSSVTATQTDIENVLNGVEAIYKADVGIEYSITTIMVRTTESDPYSQTSPGSLLNQFSGHWNSSQGAIPRDVAHLFTGKNLDGSVIGIAQLNVICNKPNAYGLSQSKYTSQMLYRVALTAHEVGHNWSAQHCNGAGDCSIMCSGLGGCSGDVNSFGAGEKAQIINKKNSVSCLSDAGPTPPPTAASLTPNSVKAFLPSNVTLTGTNLSSTLKVTVGGIEVNGSNGLLSATDTQVTFIPPMPTSLGNKTVTVTTTGGTSGGVTLAYTETSPPALSAEFLGFTAQPYVWNWGAGANDAFWLVVSVNPSTILFQGHEMLTNYTIVLAGALNGAGVGSLTVNIPVSVAGLSFFTQVFTFNPLVPSNITNTWIPF